jgi:hypothetical protein
MCDLGVSTYFKLTASAHERTLSYSWPTWQWECAERVNYLDRETVSMCPKSAKLVARDLKN